MQPNYGRLVSSFYRDNSFDLSFSDRIDAVQTGRNAVPTISVTATVPLATEAGPTNGIFTLQRIGDTSQVIDVQVSLTGTAIAGVNYLGYVTVVHFNVGDVLQQVVITPILGGLGALTSATVILTAVPTGDSSYYAAFTAVPNGPLSSTDFFIIMNNQATIQITH